MDQNDIAIIGYGVVGRDMHRTFPKAHYIDLNLPRVGDALHDYVGQRIYRVAFVCVPTPPLPDGSCDTSIVQRAIEENDAALFVIKSTVPPGTTRHINTVTKKHCIFSPEFTGATQHSVAIDDGFVILGGVDRSTAPVAELYKSVKPATFRIHKTSMETAELVKYAENAFLAMKVTFFNEMHRIILGINDRGMGSDVDLDDFREALLLDPRIGREHSFTYRDHPWWASKCFDKDLPALVEWARQKDISGTDLVEAVMRINDGHKDDGMESA